MKSNYLATGGIFSNAQNHRQSTQKGESSATSTLQNIFIYSKAKESELFFLRKSCLVIILLILSVLITSGQTTFTLTAPARTSAGIYKTDGTLIRTLWNNVQKNAGTYQIKWDGTNDDSATVPAGNYNVKVLTNNVNYRWEGVIGNTSASFTGPDIHKGYLRMYSMCIAGNTAYYSNYYNEGHSSQFKISLDNPQSRTEILSYGQSSLYSATDGKTVYWAGDDVLGGHNNWFVFGTQVSDDKEESFSSGQSYAVQYGRTYSSVISLTSDKDANITGLAVQKNGNYLFISRQNYNTIHVLDKNTGAFVRALSIPAANRLAVDANDNLWIVSGTGINKYSINADGSLGNVSASINGFSQAWAIAVSPDNNTVTISDGGTSQQVKGYSNSDGSLLWTYGQAGGYAASPAVTNDKFYFNDQRHDNDGSFLAYQPDGSFWVEDAGNYRAQHYTSNRNFIDRIMYMPGFYGAAADPNNPARVFADLLEFNANYSMPLAPNNGSWSLVNNWGYKITSAYTYKEGLRNVTTLSNGKTYALIKHYDKFAVLELAANGIRYTGIETNNYANKIEKDGSLLEWGGGPAGQPFGAGTHPLSGFDASNNPIWGSSFADVARTEPMIPSDPYAFGSGNVVKTSSGTYIAFDAGLPPNSSTDYHLGGFQNNHWNWKTAKSTFKEYAGLFPDDGSYDIGNGVVYGGSMAATLDNTIVWGYHGEFWKGGECNFYNHVNEDGLSIGQFGTGTGTNAAAELAGNSTSLVIVKDGNGNGYLYNNDESVHGGLHRWKITGLNTIAEQVIPIDANFVRSTDENPDLPGVDLMAGLPFNSFLPNAFGWQNSDPNVYDGTTLTWWYGKTNNFSYHKRSTPDVYITFHQNAYSTRSITRDLGANNSLTTWKLSGVINYNNSLPDGLGGAIYLEVLDDNDKVIARLNHEVIFGANNSKTTKLYGNQSIIHTDESDTFSKILWKDQPVKITAEQGGITFDYANFAPVTVPVLDPSADWQSPKKMRVFISGGGGYDRRIELVSMRFISNAIIMPPINNANLSNLILSQGSITPAFAQAIDSYNSSVPNNIISLSVTPTAATAEATVKINGEIVNNANPSVLIALAEGSNIISIVVTAKDGTTTKTYTVNVTRATASGDVCESAPAQAYSSNTQTGNQAHRGELGLEFTVNNANGILIKHLGAFDDGGNGITGLQPGGGIRVAIFNKSTHTIVPGLDITIRGQADFYIGNHRMKTITPVILLPGEYVLVAKGYHAGEKNGNVGIGGGPFPVDNGGGAITFGKGDLFGADDTTGFNYPTKLDKGTNHQFLAGTFNFTGVISCVPAICESAPVLAYTSSIQTGNQSHKGELGLEFSVNDAKGIIVKQLGAFDDGGNGITGLQPGGGVRVAIFNKATHTIVPGLDATIIGIADAYTGNHRMKNINPVILLPGEYVIVAKGYHAGEKNGNVGIGGGPFPVDDGGGAVTFGKGDFFGTDDSIGFNYPTKLDKGTNHQFLAGTFNFTKNIPCALASVAIVTNSINQTEVSTKAAGIVKTNGLKVYPNPTDGEFNLQLTDVKGSKLVIRIINANGKLVEQKIFSVINKTPSLVIPFNLVNLQSGIYLINVQSIDGVKTEKLIIQR